MQTNILLQGLNVECACLHHSSVVEHLPTSQRAILSQALLTAKTIV
jgi:hypothetical protein